MSSPRGVIVLFTVLALGVVAVATTSALSRGSLEGYLASVEANAAWCTRAKAFGCLDEMLIQLKKDANFAPTSIFMGQATCTVSVTTPQSGQRTVTVSLTEANITRTATALVTVSPFAVTQVTEP